MLKTGTFTTRSPVQTPPSRRTITCALQTPVESPTSPADKDKPDWTGDGLLSKAVNAAINFPPLFAVMKLGARAAIKGTAEKKGVPWAETVDTLQQSEVGPPKLVIVYSPSGIYPSLIIIIIIIVL